MDEGELAFRGRLCHRLRFGVYVPILSVGFLKYIPL